MGLAPFWSKVRDPRLPKPCELPPPRDPPEYPPPPPLALAKETVGAPIRAQTMHAAMSFVVFKLGVLSIDVGGQSLTREVILPVMVSKKPIIR